MTLVAESEREVIARIAREGRDLVDKLFTDMSFSLGTSVLASFDRSVVKDLNISKLGRMGIEGGKMEFYAAPRVPEPERIYEPHPAQYLDEAERYARGLACDFSGLGNYDFTPRVVRKEKNMVNYYEEAVLRTMVQKHGYIVLVNPAVGTVWRAAEYRCDIFLSPQAMKHKEELVQAMKDSQAVRMKFKTALDPNDVCYLGSNGCNFDAVNWVALTPNPFAQAFPFTYFSCVVGKDGVDMRYQRKHREVHVFLETCPAFTRYSPAQLDRICKGAKLGFFLDTNCLDLTIPNEGGGPHCCFVPAFPPYVNDISQDETTVYDVRSNGTYLSRRDLIERTAHGLGKVAVPLGNGACQITWYGDTAEDVFCHSYGNVVSFIEERIVIGGTKLVSTAQHTLAVYSLAFGDDSTQLLPGGSIRTIPVSIDRSDGKVTYVAHLEDVKTAKFFFAHHRVALLRMVPYICSVLYHSPLSHFHYVHDPRRSQQIVEVPDRIIMMLQGGPEVGGNPSLRLIEASVSVMVRRSFTEALHKVIMLMCLHRESRVRYSYQLHLAAWSGSQDYSLLEEIVDFCKPIVVNDGMMSPRQIADWSGMSESQVLAYLGCRRDVIRWGGYYCYWDNFQLCLPGTFIRMKVIYDAMWRQKFYVIPELSMEIKEFLEEFLYDQGMIGIKMIGAADGIRVSRR